MKKILKKLTLIIILIGVLFTSLIVYLGHQEYLEVIAEESIESTVLRVQSRNDYVTLEEIPDMVEKAMIAVEDKRFYTRKGVLDFRSLGRAVIVNIKSMSLMEGGSTIPQQVSKNLYFDHSASFVRKVSEYFVTRDLFDYVSRETVLELYLNIAYFGDGYTGINQATQGYFDLEIEELSDAQATLLVGIVQSPSNYQLSNHYDRAKKRQTIVLQRLVEQGIITETDAENYYNEGI